MTTPTTVLATLFLLHATIAWSQTPVRIGNEFQVNSYTTHRQNYPSVHIDPAGGFVVVWASYGSYGSDNESWSIQGQRFSMPVIFADGFESGGTSAWSSTQ